MKNTNAISRAYWRRFILQFLFITFLYIVLVFLCLTVFRQPLSSLLRRVLGFEFLSFLSYRMEFFILIAYILCLAIFIRHTFKNFFQSLNLLSRTIQSGLDETQTIPTFPPELKELEVQLKDMQHSLYQNKQLAHEAEQRKNDLVVYLAHDLKTPLTSIIGYLILLEEIPDLPMEQRAKYTAITLDKAYRLEQLINEFFEITRFNLQSISLDNNRIDLGMMLRQMLDEFYPVLEDKQLEVQTDIPDGLHIIADADKLARVFDNLMRNAVSYSYPKTCITVRVYTQAQQVVISFRNIGDEIPVEKQARIFEKFFRLDSSRGTQTGGAGLGLAIAKQLVEAHGGTIRLQSNACCTELFVCLPTKLSAST